MSLSDELFMPFFIDSAGEASAKLYYWNQEN
jgi:hypothetical protein